MVAGYIQMYAEKDEIIENTLFNVQYELLI